MRTFLDRNRGVSKTFVIDGNLNDIYYTQDMVARTFEQYLVYLLKSRGYEHVIFFGEDGTKGAYCLDDRSSRFFFKENREIPEELMNRLGMEAPDGGDAAAPKDSGMRDDGKNQTRAEELRQESRTASAVRRPGKINSMVHRKAKGSGYRPGQTGMGAQAGDGSQSETDGNARIGEGAEAGGSTLGGQKTGTDRNLRSGAAFEAGGNAVGDGKVGTPGVPRQFRYARRTMCLSEFLNMILPLMLDRESHMAVVFYNIFTTDLNRYQSLRNCILDVWEKRDMDNCCLLLAPNTQFDENSLINYIQNMNMQSRFLLQREGRFVLNPRVCCHIGFPQEDEVKNLLRRYMIVGAGRKHQKLKLKYRDLDEIADEIVYCSRSFGGGGKQEELNFEYMRELRIRLENYMEDHEKGGYLEIKKENVRPIWNLPEQDKESALERLNRRGWEKPYDFMRQMVQAWERLQKDQPVKKEKKAADWAIGRIALRENEEDAPRIPIPNFVLTGSQGTGKSTIARLIGEILKEAGILKRGHTVEVKKQDLTSSLVAGIPKATMECVDRAEEGVLFIDEAHELATKDGGVNNEGTGVEVVSTLCGAMTDPNRHFCVILAGYPEKMKEVFKLDDGFERRFDMNFILIDDYRPEVLQDVLLGCFKEDGYEVAPELLAEIPEDDHTTTPLACLVNRIYAERNRRTFGNADAMVKLARYAEGHCENRCITKEALCRGEIDESWFHPANVGNSLEQILRELRENYVGLENICTMFEDLHDEILDNKVNGTAAIDVLVRSMILVGNPGTGKTTIAKMLGRLLFSLGVLGSPEPVIVNASQFASKYAGGSLEIAEQQIQEAQNRRGLIFVDEAHNLLDGNFDGRGVFRSFMAPLTDSDKPIVAVFAVYPRYLQQFLAMDPGSSRRFRIFRLEDYTGEQLFEILELMMKKKGYQMSGETETAVRKICGQIYADRNEDTGNAGKMERLLEDMNRLRRRRCRENKIAFDSEESKIFLPQDIPEDALGSLPKGTEIQLL